MGRQLHLHDLVRSTVPGQDKFNVPAPAPGFKDTGIPGAGLSASSGVFPGPARSVQEPPAAARTAAAAASMAVRLWAGSGSLGQLARSVYCVGRVFVPLVFRFQPGEQMEAGGTGLAQFVEFKLIARGLGGFAPPAAPGT